MFRFCFFHSSQQFPQLDFFIFNLGDISVFIRMWEGFLRNSASWRRPYNLSTLLGDDRDVPYER